MRAVVEEAVVSFPPWRYQGLLDTKHFDLSEIWVWFCLVSDLSGRLPSVAGCLLLSARRRPTQDTRTTCPSRVHAESLAWAQVAPRRDWKELRWCIASVHPTRLATCCSHPMSTGCLVAENVGQQIARSVGPRSERRAQHIMRLARIEPAFFWSVSCQHQLPCVQQIRDH